MSSKNANIARLGLEPLEAREVPSVTFHGGRVLNNVEVETIYLGQEWASSRALQLEIRQVDTFVDNLVHSSYMDMLNQYGAGRGTFIRHDIVSDGSTPAAGESIRLTDTTPVNLDSGSPSYSSATIEGTILHEAQEHRLDASNPNFLAFVFLPPNVKVLGQPAFGFHSAVPQSGGLNIPYAVVANPVGNPSLPLAGQSAFVQQTVVASHELAEAVTNPDLLSNWTPSDPGGWYDGDPKHEIGDLANTETKTQFVYLNGYAVQRIADRHDQPMTPAGATTRDHVNFVLTSDNSLYMCGGGNRRYVAGGVASVSDQGIDDNGLAMVDAVLTDGTAIEIHANAGATSTTSVPLGSGVSSAAAGQGISYVLYNDGTVKEFVDLDGSYRWRDHRSLRSVDAGTDQYGVNMLVEVDTSNSVRKSSDRADFEPIDWRLLPGSYTSASAGQQGIIALLDADGVASLYSDASASTRSLATNATAVAAGTNSSGGWEVAVLFGSTAGYFTPSTGSSPVYFAWYQAGIGKPQQGYVPRVDLNGNALVTDPWGNDSSLWQASSLLGYFNGIPVYNPRGKVGAVRAV
jgi:hypothetical protein